MKPVIYLALGLILVSQIVCPKAIAEVPPYAGIRDIRMSGNGCESSSALAAVSPDFKDLSVLFSDYSVEIGKGSRNSGDRAVEKRCLVELKVDVPAGWSFTFDSIDYRGFAMIPKGTIGYHGFTIEGGQLSGLGFSAAALKGPMNQNFTITTRNQLKSSTWTSCSGSGSTVDINLKSVIGLRNLLFPLVKPQAMLMLDTSDTSIRQSFKLNWRRCR